MTAMNDKCLTSRWKVGVGPLGIPLGESLRLLCNMFDLAFHKNFDWHTRTLSWDRLFFSNVAVSPKRESDSKEEGGTSSDKTSDEFRSHHIEVGNEARIEHQMLIPNPNRSIGLYLSRPIYN